MRIQSIWQHSRSLISATVLAIALVACIGIVGSPLAQSADAGRPNVILVITDDQGWGDFGFHGNPRLKTPNFDRLASEGVELTNFLVCPVCSPTRASLMTGRYNYRTGVVDTYLGRSTMAADEVTLAEMLSASGYRTGIFGKWHLGDNYPSRASDQGFTESLVHRGGGIGQPADPPGNSYFDPVLWHNNREYKSKGYCSDVFTDAAMEFIAHKSEQPFFAYLAFNCPHTPLQVSESYAERYRRMGLDESTARVYGMVANIDDNIGRLLDRLRELKLDKNTIVVFLNDNGPQSPRYNGKLRDLKGSVYEGGIRTPCLVRWPAQLTAGRKVADMAAHIDLTPTLLAACDVQPPASVKFDGRNVLPLLKGDAIEWPARNLFFQWHRGDEPVRHRACAVRGPKYKLVQSAGRGDAQKFTPKWELFDLVDDPAESHDLAAAQPAVVAEMKAAYDAWFHEISRGRGFGPPQILVGTLHENPVTLTRQDWRGGQAGWNADSGGNWHIEPVAGAYEITVRVAPQKVDTTMLLRVGDREWREPLPTGADQAVFKDVSLKEGVTQIEARLEGSPRPVAAQYIDVLMPSVARTDK